MLKMVKKAWDKDVVAIFVMLWGVSAVVAVLPFLAAR